MDDTTVMMTTANSILSPQPIRRRWNLRGLIGVAIGMSVGLLIVLIARPQLVAPGHRRPDPIVPIVDGKPEPGLQTVPISEQLAVNVRAEHTIPVKLASIRQIEGLVPFEAKTTNYGRTWTWELPNSSLLIRVDGYDEKRIFSCVVVAKSYDKYYPEYDMVAALDFSGRTFGDEGLRRRFQRQWTPETLLPCMFVDGDIRVRMRLERGLSIVSATSFNDDLESLPRKE